MMEEWATVAKGEKRNARIGILAILGQVEMATTQGTTGRTGDRS
jgi:hypothetical protein